MSEKRDLLLLLSDIHECCQKIKRYTFNMSDIEFFEDEKTKDAVVRNFEIIGEATAQIDNDFKLKHPEVAWREIKDFRNRMIHDYSGIDYAIVWVIISENLDELEFQINQLIKELN